MDLSRTVSETGGDFDRKLQNFPPRVFYAPADWVPLSIGYRHEAKKMVGYQTLEKVLR